MKKIILLFFTFSGICSGFSQPWPKNTDSNAVVQSKVANILPLKTDSIKAKEKSSVRVFPNPAKNKVDIEVNGFEPGYVKLQLLSVSGKMLREEKRLVLTGTEIIIFMFSEVPGFYYLVLTQGAILRKNKLIIQ